MLHLKCNDSTRVKIQSGTTFICVLFMMVYMRMQNADHQKIRETAAAAQQQQHSSTATSSRYYNLLARIFRPGANEEILSEKDTIAVAKTSDS